MNTNAANNKSEERVITVADLWRVFLTALPLMIIVAIIIVGIGYAYKKATYRPQYTSEGSFLVMRDRLETGENLNTSQEASFALGMIPSCYEVMTSYTVFELAAQKLNENGGSYTVAQVRSAISVSTNEKSIIMTVRATAYEKVAAKTILTAYMQAAKAKADELMNKGNDFLSYLDQPRSAVRSSSFGTIRILFLGVLGAIAVYSVYLILDILDDRIRTGEDLVDVAGMTLLGIIPDAYTSERKYSYKYGRKYAKHYGRYGISHTQKKKEG